MAAESPPAAVALTHEWFDRHSGWAPPDHETLAEWLAGGTCLCPDACEVVPSQPCPHGLASWWLVLVTLDRPDRPGPLPPERLVPRADRLDPARDDYVAVMDAHHRRFLVAGDLGYADPATRVVRAHGADSVGPGRVLRVGLPALPVDRADVSQHHHHHLSDAIDEVVGGPARRRVIILLGSILGLQAADTGAVGALAAPLEKSFHIGNTDIGLLVTVTTLVGCVATLPFGTITDRYNRTRVLQFVVALWAVATVVSALSTSFGMLLVTRLALGGVIAAAGPALASLFGDLVPGDERSRL